jgi:hypothetical protein
MRSQAHVLAERSSADARRRAGVLLTFFAPARTRPLKVRGHFVLAAALKAVAP